MRGIAFIVSKKRDEMLVPSCNNFLISVASSEPTGFSIIKSQGVLVRGNFKAQSPETPMKLSTVYLFGSDLFIQKVR